MLIILLIVTQDILINRIPFNKKKEIHLCMCVSMLMRSSLKIFFAKYIIFFLITKCHKNYDIIIA